jgi:predicted nucleic acid-binding Zn ribbon protein
VNTIADILKTFLPSDKIEEAEGYHQLFTSWMRITQKALGPKKRNISGGLALHSRIAELENSVLLVEADHPGWIQILQTEQATLLKAVQKEYPQLSINGIAFKLAR